METKHTKGEWDDTFSTALERCVRTKNGYVCFLPKPFHYQNQDKRYEEELEEVKANAKLIAAAPDMLEALILIDWANSVPPKDWDEKTYQACQKVREAIKKATE